MKRIAFCAALVVALVYGCTGNRNSENNIPLATGEVRTEFRDSIIYPAEADTIRVDIIDGTGSLKIHKRKDEGVNLRFNSQNYTKLDGKLTSNDSTANIRFSMIGMPDGSTDGPFGREIEYELVAKGDYMLYIHENIMAGDPWEGDFEITVSLSK